jgi:hypothetical protein
MVPAVPAIQPSVGFTNLTPLRLAMVPVDPDKSSQVCALPISGILSSKNIAAKHRKNFIYISYLLHFGKFIQLCGPIYISNDHHLMSNSLLVTHLILKDFVEAKNQCEI